MTRAVRYYSLFDGTGYGSAAMRYMECLIEQGVTLKWSPLVLTRFGFAPWELIPVKYRPNVIGVSERQDRLTDHIDLELDYDTVIMHVMPELYPKLREEGKRNVAYTVWETTKLPAHWGRPISHVDLMLVPSKFNEKLFCLPDGPSVYRVPHMLSWQAQFANQSPDAIKQFRQRLGVVETTTAFFCLGAWAPRKAMLETIHCYLSTFTQSDDVCFIVKTDKTGTEFTDSGARRDRKMVEILDDVLGEYNNPATVILIDQFLSDAELALFYAAGDCYFSLTHSEGWGLGLYAAAEFAKPIITTGWGGQVDFLPRDLAYLVDYKMVPVNELPGWESYSSEQEWAQADDQHAQQLLRQVHNDLSSACSMGSRLRDFVVQEFSDQVVLNQLMSALYENGS